MSTRPKPISIWRSRRTTSSRACSEASSIAVGSSATRILGLATSARARAMRCSCPPDSSWLRASRNVPEEGRPTSSSAWLTSSPRRCLSLVPSRSRGSAISSRTVRRGESASQGSCMTSWMSRRTRRSCRRQDVGSADPRNTTWPASGDRCPVRIRARVDLPLPEGPTMPTDSPSSSVRDTPRRARTSRRSEWKDLRTSVALSNVLSPPKWQATRRSREATRPGGAFQQISSAWVQRGLYGHPGGTARGSGGSPRIGRRSLVVVMTG